jgi:hypothetical protein
VRCGDPEDSTVVVVVSVGVTLTLSLDTKGFSDAGTEFRGSAVESPSRTNLPCILGTQVLYYVQKEGLAFQCYVVLSYHYCHYTLNITLHRICLNRTNDACRLSQGNFLQLHLIKNRETNAKLLIPNEIPWAKIPRLPTSCFSATTQRSKHAEQKTGKKRNRNRQSVSSLASCAPVCSLRLSSIYQVFPSSTRRCCWSW